MKTLLLTVGAVMAMMIVTAACSEQPLEPSDGPSWLVADLRGAVGAEHEANARFHEGPDHWGNIPMLFTLGSSGEDALGR